LHGLILFNDLHFYPSQFAYGGVVIMLENMIPLPVIIVDNAIIVACDKGLEKFDDVPRVLAN
jgi:hypothetical protein